MKAILRPKVSRPVSWCQTPSRVAREQILLLSDGSDFINAGRSVWREDGSVVYKCYWFWPAQSLSRPSPVGLMTIFYCLRFQTPPTRWARSPYLHPPGTGWPRYTPRHWIPFPSPPTTCRATMEVFEPASTWATRCLYSLAVKLLLALTSTVILGFEFHGSHDHILMSDGSGSLQISRVRVTLRPAGYRQSVRLSAKPLENKDQKFLFSFATEPLRS
jgi:hypothetical protein